MSVFNLHLFHEEFCKSLCILVSLFTAFAYFGFSFLNRRYCPLVDLHTEGIKLLLGTDNAIISHPIIYKLRDILCLCTYHTHMNTPSH